MKNIIQMIRSFIISALCLLFFESKSQSSLKDSIISEMQTIARTKDSATMLHFQMDMHYKTDTLLGEFQNQHFLADYKVDRGRFYYTMGDMEFLQRDSLMVMIDKANKVILVSKPKTSSGAGLPTQGLLDSAIANLESHFSYSLQIGDTLRTIEMVSLDTSKPVRSFKIVYNNLYQLREITYKMQFGGQVYDRTDSLGLAPMQVLRKADLILLFSPYSFKDYPQDIFTISNVVEEYIPGQYVPNERFKGYYLHKTFASLEDHQRSIQE